MRMRSSDIAPEFRKTTNSNVRVKDAPAAIGTAKQAVEAFNRIREYRRLEFNAHTTAMQRSGSQPDLGIVLPGGQCAWVEMKDAGGLVSAVQQDVHDDLRAIGHRVGVATDIDTCRTLFVTWGVGLREPPGQPTPAPRVRYAPRRARLPEDDLPF